LLNVAAGKGHKRVAFQKVKHALTQEICNDADVVAEVESIPQMNAFVAVALVV